MPTTAYDLILEAFTVIGVVSEGAALTAGQAQTGLVTLNRMVSGWSTQPGTTICVQRTIFNLVNNQQTYTIGLGGEFNVPRPVRTIPGAGLLLEGLASPQAVTGIARSDYTATVEQTAHGFAVGDEAYLSGANEIAYNGLQTVETVPDADHYTFTVQGTPVTPATGTITAQAVQGTPTEIPRAVITDAAYQYNQIKNMGNSQFTNVYYNPTFPFGTIVLWPRITTAINQLVLYLENIFTGFADLHTAYDWPSVPGYAEALTYQLALRLSLPFGRPVSDTLAHLAQETFGLIKRANNRLADLPSDAGLLTFDPRNGYNINTDQGG